MHPEAEPGDKKFFYYPQKLKTNEQIDLEVIKYKKACTDISVAYLMIILKFFYLSTILTPTQVHPKQGLEGQLSRLSRLLLESIAIRISIFFPF